jgi:hypothetical protein
VDLMIIPLKMRVRSREGVGWEGECLRKVDAAVALLLLPLPIFGDA